MERLIVHPTTTSSWHALVDEAERVSKINLSEDLESYLVFLLMRFIKEPILTKSLVALDFLESAQQLGRQRKETLQAVGDKCLLFSGLFTGLAERKRLRVGYYVQIGQGAYSSLSNERHDLAELYHNLSKEFVRLMDILQVIRDYNGDYAMSPLQAEELWADTGSHHAKQILERKFDDANCIIIDDSHQTRH